MWGKISQIPSSSTIVHQKRHEYIYDIIAGYVASTRGGYNSLMQCYIKNDVIDFIAMEQLVP